MSWQRTLRVVHLLEDALVAVLLLVMISLAVAQILLRNLFDGGLLWGDPLLRILVLWIALIGAVVASRERQHISMDVVTRFLNRKWRHYASILTGVFTAAICLILAKFTWEFVMVERESATTVFAEIPAWWCQAVMPVAFTLIAFRYLVQAGGSLFGHEEAGERHP